MAMTEQEYFIQNRKGFEGDTILQAFVENLIKEKGIKKVLEGGTYLGSTTKLFAKMAESVDSIEIKEEYYNEAKKYLINDLNVNLFLGSTLDIMPVLLQLYKDDNYLFFCDSHWGEHNPLLEELAIIARFGHKPHIIIHDFKVPDHPELEFDSYSGQDYEWSWIEKYIQNIYGIDNFRVEYNEKAVGATRGIVYISPKNQISI